jgi:hypothetical protein
MNDNAVAFEGSVVKRKKKLSMVVGKIEKHKYSSFATSKQPAFNNYLAVPGKLWIRPKPRSKD